MHKKQTNKKKNKYEADTLKAAELRRRSLETFSESNARLTNEPMVKNLQNFSQLLQQQEQQEAALLALLSKLADQK